MGGFTHWSFGGEKAVKDEIAAQGGTSSGGNNGFIIAGDVAIQTSPNTSVGVGGWYNKLAAFTAQLPGTPFNSAAEATHSFSSFYGNFFYQHVGVQADVIPVRGQTTITDSNGTKATDDIGQTDFAIFGVARVSSKPGRPRWSAMGGLGLYRYGSRPQSTTLNFAASPAANAFSIFVNGLVGIANGVSIDASIWYTAADKNFSTTSDIGNQSQTRFTIGIGFSF